MYIQRSQKAILFSTTRATRAAAGSRQQSSLALLSNRLKDKPFWIWNIQEHKRQNIITNGDCCFNHIIGLPQKDGITKPIFDYQKILFDTCCIRYDRHIWVKKSTGIGATEFVLRIMAKCYRYKRRD